MPAYDPAMFSLDVNDPDDLELIEMFLEALPERVESLQTAIQSEDITELERLSHQLKGAAPGFGCDPIGAAAGELEAELKSNQDASIADIKSQLDALIETCNTYMRAA